MADIKSRWYTRTTRSKKYAFFDGFIAPVNGRSKGSAWDEIMKDIYLGPDPAPPSGFNAGRARGAVCIVGVGIHAT